MEHLQEFVSVGQGMVDRRGGAIAGCKILGTESRNGRVYPLSTIRDAAPLYEGARVNVDHGDGAPNRSRRYGDRLGIIRNVRVDGGGLRGDLYCNVKNRLWEQLAWDAEHSPESVGLSHNIEGETKRRADGKTEVVRIVKVHSVDLVADPATSTSLFESEGDGPIGRAGLVELMRAKWLPDWSVGPAVRALLSGHTREQASVFLDDVKMVCDRTARNHPGVVAREDYAGSLVAFVEGDNEEPTEDEVRRLVGKGDEPTDQELEDARRRLAGEE